MDVDLSSEPSRLFEITVRNRWGRTSTHQVDRSWTVGYLKRVLAVGEDLPPDQQRLVCGGVELEDWRTLADYDIKDESMVNLEPMHWSLYGLRVFVEVPSGERLDLDIGSPWTSIWWVKQLIQGKGSLCHNNDSPGMACPLARRTTCSRTTAPWQTTTSGATPS